MDAGKLVDDATVLGMIRERLAQPDALKGFILDGFPRNIAQAEALEKLLGELGQPLEAVVLMNLDLGVLFKRLTGRRICQDCGRVFNVYTSPPGTPPHCEKCGDMPRLMQRPDDKEEVIGKRLEVYRGANQAADQALRGGRPAARRGCRRRCRNGVQEHPARGAGPLDRSPGALDLGRSLRAASRSSSFSPISFSAPAREGMHIALAHRERLEFAARRQYFGAYAEFRCARIDQSRRAGRSPPFAPAWGASPGPAPGRRAQPARLRAMPRAGSRRCHRSAVAATSARPRAAGGTSD